MEATFRVRVLTAERTVLDAEVVSLQARGSQGFFGVLAHHAPFITALTPGPLTLKYPGGRREVLQVGAGCFEVSGNHAVVLADTVS